MVKRDSSTLDLFDWRPPKLVARYPEERVRAYDLRVRLAKAVSETLNDCPMNRELVAMEMANWLGEDVSKASLDAYASPAKDAHTISYVRLMAMVHVTNDRRLLQIAADPMGWSVVEEQYLDWVEIGQLSDMRNDLDRHLAAARQRARRGGR